MNKKIFSISAFLLSSMAFGFEGTVKTGIEITPEFGPNLEKKLKFKNTNVEYKARILDLDISFKDYGVNFGTVLKSSRKDARLNDFLKDHNNDKNHDFMLKLYGSYESPEFYGLKNKISAKYYVNNFTTEYVYFDEEKGIYKEPENFTKYSYIEEDGSEEVLGNMLFNNKLSGKILGKTDFNFELEYKANQFNRFDRDKSYLKTDLEVKHDFGKVNTEFSYGLNYDLHLGSKPFNTFNNELNSYPDYIPNNFVSLIKQNSKTKLEYKGIDKSKLIANLNATLDTYLVGTEHVDSETEVVWNVFKPNIDLSFERELKYGKLEVGVTNQLHQEYTKYYAINGRTQETSEHWLAYKPGLLLKYNYEGDLTDKDKLKVSTENTYQAGITLYPYLTEAKYISHEANFKNNLEYNRKLTDKHSLVLNFDTDLKVPYRNRILQQIEGKASLKLTTKSEFGKLKLTNELLDNFESKSIVKTLNPDTFSNEIKLTSKLEYTIFEDKTVTKLETKEGEKEKTEEKLNENLKLELKAVARNKSSYNFYIDNDKKYAGDEESNVKKPSERYIYAGHAVAVINNNTLSLDTKVTHFKKLNDKVSLTSKGEINTALNVLSIRAEKLAHYRTDEIAKDKELLKVADNENYNWNIGGKVEFVAGTKVDYEPVKNLNISVDLETKLLFERNILNLITDKNRPDNGLFGEVDKKFRFKKLVPKLGLNLKYTW